MNKTQNMNKTLHKPKISKTIFHTTEASGSILLHPPPKTSQLKLQNIDFNQMTQKYK